MSQVLHFGFEAAVENQMRLPGDYRWFANEVCVAFRVSTNGSGPHEWFAVFVVMGNELIDTLDQLVDRAKLTPADGLVGNQRK
jgi:hypothetical protein